MGWLPLRPWTVLSALTAFGRRFHPLMCVNVSRDLRRLAVGLLVVISPDGQATAEPEQAEYALRWDPREGGPRTAEAVMQLLGMKIGVPDHYTVRYYDLPTPSAAPAHATVMLRERKKAGGKHQFRLKYRLTEPLAQAPPCPPGSDFAMSSEVDVTWLSAKTQQRVYAYSCSLQADQLPATLAATPKPCSAAMTRYKAKGLKLEAWAMPDGSLQWEVSRAAANDAAAFQAFQATAMRLLAQGVKPTDRSKTELGSRCP